MQSKWKKRAKWAFWILAIVLISQSTEPNAPIPLKTIISLSLYGVVVWLAWKVFVFFSLLLRPVRQAVKPVVDPINAHVDASLRGAGLGKVADLGNAVQNTVDHAINAAEHRKN